MYTYYTYVYTYYIIYGTVYDRKGYSNQDPRGPPVSLSLYQNFEKIDSQGQNCFLKIELV